MDPIVSSLLIDFQSSGGLIMKERMIPVFKENVACSPLPHGVTSFVKKGSCWITIISHVVTPYY